MFLLDSGHPQGCPFFSVDKHGRAYPKFGKDADFDRAHFAAYGASSLDFEFVYYVVGPDYTKYMDIQQAINLQIFESYSKAKTEFAYPNQTLFLNQAN